jgi:hypothetical protein
LLLLPPGLLPNAAGREPPLLLLPPMLPKGLMVARPPLNSMVDITSHYSQYTP